MSGPELQIIVHWWAVWEKYHPMLASFQAFALSCWQRKVPWKTRTRDLFIWDHRFKQPFPRDRGNIHSCILLTGIAAVLLLPYSSCWDADRNFSGGQLQRYRGGGMNAFWCTIPSLPVKDQLHFYKPVKDIRVAQFSWEWEPLYAKLGLLNKLLKLFFCEIVLAFSNHICWNKGCYMQRKQSTRLQKLRLSQKEGKLFPFCKVRTLKIENLIAHMEPSNAIFRIMFQKRDHCKVICSRGYCEPVLEQQYCFNYSFLLSLYELAEGQRLT